VFPKGAAIDRSHSIIWIPMQEKELTFVIPTHRLRDVGEAVEAYDEHFWRNGHSVQILVFDDSTLSNQAKYYSHLESTTTHQPVYYVGPYEKERFMSYLNSRLRDQGARKEPLPSELRRKSQLHPDVHTRRLYGQFR
jgi:hypothetical protein